MAYNYLTCKLALYSVNLWIGEAPKEYEFTHVILCEMFGRQIPTNGSHLLLGSIALFTELNLF